MPYTLVLNVIVLNFSFYRDAVNNDSCTSTGIECEEIENNRNALTWCYSKKLPPNRKSREKRLQSAQGGVLWLSLLTRGRPEKGGTESASGPQGGARGRGEETF